MKKNPLTGRMNFKNNILIALFFFALLNLVIFPLAFASERQGTVEFMIGSYSLKDPAFVAVYQKSGTIRGIVLSSYLVNNFNCYLEIKEFYKLGNKYERVHLRGLDYETIYAERN